MLLCMQKATSSSDLNKGDLNLLTSKKETKQNRNKNKPLVKVYKSNEKISLSEEGIVFEISADSSHEGTIYILLLFMLYLLYIDNMYSFLNYMGIINKTT